MAFDYLVYGVPVTANQSLPHLVARPHGDLDSLLDIKLGCEAPSGVDRIRYGDHRGVLDVGISSGGHRVWMNLRGDDNPGTIGDVTGVLVGPVLGGLLRLWRRVSLHGCVVASGGSAVVILGRRGAGKSTLAAAMARAGHPVLSDDLAALSERAPEDWWVEPGYPRLRLAPDSAAFLLSDSDRAPDAGPVVTGSQRRYVSLDADGRRGWCFGSEGMDLAAVYELQRASGCGAPRVSPLAGAESMATLVRHLKPAVVPLPPATRAHELKQLARLAAAISVRRLLVPDGYSHLADACALLDEDSGGVRPRSRMAQ